jgi:hypothetical protein
VLEVEEVEDMEEVEERKNRPAANGCESFYPLLPSLPWPPSLFFVLPFVYLLGAVKLPPEGFLTSLS